MPLEVYTRFNRVLNLSGNVGREVSASATLNSGQFVCGYMVARIFQYINFHQVAGVAQ